MNATKNDLRESTRKKVCEILNRSLADAIDLAYQAKQAHWNVKGLQFRSLHALFDEVFEASVKFGDDFAERAAQLGGVAQGTIRHAAKTSSLTEYPLELIPALEHVNLLSDRVASFCRNAREGIDACEDAGDLVSADIYTDAARECDKLLWMLESHMSGLGQTAQAGGRQAA